MYVMGLVLILVHVLHVLWRARGASRNGTSTNPVRGDGDDESVKDTFLARLIPFTRVHTLDRWEEACVLLVWCHGDLRHCRSQSRLPLLMTLLPLSRVCVRQTAFPCWQV
jgi:hypothetical protein